MFVGDSLSRDQYQSLLCLLYTSSPGIKYNETRVGDISTVTFSDFGVKVKLDRNVYLVDLVPKKIGRVLILDSVARKSAAWLANDVLVFNTYAWWNRSGASQPWDFVQVGRKKLKDIDRTVAFKTALNTWAKWVNFKIDPAQIKVFFQTVSPTHYNGAEWDSPQAKSCKRETSPVLGPVYPGPPPPALAIQKEIIRSKINNTAVRLLDITHLSQFRKDAHPTIYGEFGGSGMDCLHWCIAGVTDTWNEILFNHLFQMPLQNSLM
ncbi:OLC1v1023314C3 [Oldenlandia corymbosa var. corymbosa]|nr:OLC1v1023314C3 [Oldenlandia corymbosa var. corymbosa]